MYHKQFIAFLYMQQFLSKEQKYNNVPARFWFTPLMLEFPHFIGLQPWLSDHIIINMFFRTNMSTPALSLPKSIIQEHAGYWARFGVWLVSTELRSACRPTKEDSNPMNSSYSFSRSESRPTNEIVLQPISKLNSSALLLLPFWLKVAVKWLSLPKVSYSSGDCRLPKT